MSPFDLFLATLAQVAFVLTVGMLALRWARSVYLTALAQRHLETCPECQRNFWQPFLRCGVLLSELEAVQSGCPDWRGALFSQAPAQEVTNEP